MPQTVPSAGYTPPYCDYSAFTTDFDLSLLPASPESEVPLSPSHLSPFLSLYPSSPPMFSTSLEDGILCDNLGFVNIKTKLNDEIKSEYEDEPLHTPLKKSLSSGFFYDNQKMDTKETKDENKYDFYVKKEEDKYPLIPTTVQASTSYYPQTIKQEPNFGGDYGQDYQNNKNQPPSPYGIKTEKTIDLQEVLKESQYLQNLVKYESATQTKQYTTLQSLLKNSKTEETNKTTDHQLLRSVLRDTSFQKKFNIKPFEIPRATTPNANPNATGFPEADKEIKMEANTSEENKGDEIVEELTSEKIEPVFSLAIEQIKRDVDNTCNILGIASGKFSFFLFCSFGQ